MEAIENRTFQSREDIRTALSYYAKAYARSVIPYQLYQEDGLWNGKEATGGWNACLEVMLKNIEE